MYRTRNNILSKYTRISSQYKRYCEIPAISGLDAWCKFTLAMGNRFSSNQNSNAWLSNIWKISIRKQWRWAMAGWFLCSVVWSLSCFFAQIWNHCRGLLSLLFEINSRNYKKLKLSKCYNFKKLEGKVKCGKVNCQEHQFLCQQIGLQGFPSIMFYPISKSSIKVLFFFLNKRKYFNI